MKVMKNSSRSLLCLIATLIFQTGHAQESSGSGYILEEIVVTARKREERLQDTPVAISAFTAQELEYR